MIYSEAAYFDGAHVAHIAEWQDHRRVQNLFAVAGDNARQSRLLRAELNLPSAVVGDLADSLGRAVPLDDAENSALFPHLRAVSSTPLT
jgi:hypothetical protein